MRFLNSPFTDLTYSDVFLVPSRSEIRSRFDADLSSMDGTGTRIPLVAANMTAVTGRRMLETLARRGGMGVLPQDVDAEIAAEVVRWVKGKDPVIESAIRISPDETLNHALNLLTKRGFDHAVVVDATGAPVGLLGAADCRELDRFTTAEIAMMPIPVTLRAQELGLDAPFGSEQRNRALHEAFARCEESGAELAVVLDEQDRYIGVLSKSGAVRSTIYAPGVDAQGRLLVGAAVGINGDVAQKAGALVEAGVDVLVVDTAHGHQEKMIQALKAVRAVDPQVPIVAGNVVSAAGTRDLIEAGADIVKVGVGPGAMCTTRMMTAVGRPQFSAVLECAAEARQHGKHVWADGGVKYPRDVALALAAGASQVMVGSWLAGTYESPGDLLRDPEGRAYKESFGMASTRAVQYRTRADEAFSRARKAMFEEGISSSMMYLDPRRPSVEDIVDQITAGLRSSMTYAGAQSIAEFQERAIVGLQQVSGYEEGRPRTQSWT